MAYWTIIGTGKVGEAKGKAFGVTLDTSNDTWIANGPSVDLFFTAKQGSFKVTGLPEIGTQLIAAGIEAAFFTGLVGTSAPGDTGPGRAKDLFDWRLDSK